MLRYKIVIFIYEYNLSYFSIQKCIPYYQITIIVYKLRHLYIRTAGKRGEAPWFLLGFTIIGSPKTSDHTTPLTHPNNSTFVGEPSCSYKKRLFP